MSPTTWAAGRGPAPRRTMARRRATSTTKENGLDRKSSAPVSRASASSYSPDLAVSMRIGVHTPGLAQLAAHLVAVHPRQQEVEDDGAVLALLGPPERVEAVVAELHLEALGREARGRPPRRGGPRRRRPARAWSTVCAGGPAAAHAAACEPPQRLSGSSQVGFAMVRPHANDTTPAPDRAGGSRRLGRVLRRRWRRHRRRCHPRRRRGRRRRRPTRAATTTAAVGAADRSTPSSRTR